MTDDRHKFLFKPWGSLEIYKLDSARYTAILFIGRNTMNKVVGAGCTIDHARADLFDKLMAHMWFVCLKVEDEHL